MAILTLRSLHKDFGIKEILRDANFTLETQDKVGLIGTNGSGKSTLLKMLAGLEPYDSGDLEISNQMRRVYLPQQPDLNPELTVLEQVFAASGERMQLVRDYELLSQKIAHNPEPSLLNQLARLQEKMDASSAWDLETQAKMILSKLGIQDFERPVGELSGGYRKRIALAAALMAEADLLLMDEPTNHLDAGSVEWLQEYLQRYRGALILITHDRYFLDQVTNRIIEIDQGDFYSYAGNYAYYLEKKALATESINSSRKKHVGLLRRELAWLQRGPKARSTKQKARIQRVEELQEKQFKTTQGKVEIGSAARRLGKKVIELKNVSKQFGDHILIKDFTYEFTGRDRVGIVGPNGAGKSTLMNLITGRLKADSGAVDIGSTVHFGYFDQHSEDLLDSLNQELRVLDYLKETAEYVKLADGAQITASQMLERFLFPPNQQYVPLHKLSGGEKRRLFLLHVLMQSPNVMILDEPTNDLDVQTLAVLEEYLSDFPGTVIVVSHDRYFLDRTVDEIFALETAGNIRRYPGNYSIYQEIKAKEDKLNPTVPKEKVETSSPSTKPTQKPVDSNKPRRLSNYERREYNGLEDKIAQLEEQKAELEKQLYENPPADYAETSKLAEQLEDLNQTIEEKTLRWMELAERADL
ncbi:MAG: ABC-F family ATP-binding cassette domain-containing protein [Cyanobacteria bacterium P01_H01_bin.15]